MKRLPIALGTCLLMVTVLVTPALGAAQKVDLVPAVALPNAPGGGFVVFNNSAGHDNLKVTVALKGVAPVTDYDIYLFVDQTSSGTKVGTVTTNRAGNATFHMKTTVPHGKHALGVDVTLHGSWADLYLSDHFYTLPGMSATLTFK
jgi:hypothetical protein